MEKRQLIDAIRREIRSATGREYRLDLDALDILTLRALLQAWRDAAEERQIGVIRPRRRQPLW
jgi:hypothetical protein